MITKIFYAIAFRLRKLFETTKQEVPYALKREIILKQGSPTVYTTFVETGTFFGDTVEFFRTKFEHVISVELQPDLAAKAMDRFKSYANVTIMEGDSGVLIKKIVDELDGPSVFWLDGHYSSEFMVGNELIKTARSAKNTPVELELEHILSNGFDHIILIDDARDFTGRYDYPTIKAVKQLVKKYKPAYTCFVHSDIIHILPPTAAA